MSIYRNYSDSSYGKTRNESIPKTYLDARINSKIASRYGGTYRSSLLPTSTDPCRSDNYSRIKNISDNDAKHPSTSNKSSISRWGNRCQDPSSSSGKSEQNPTSSHTSYLRSNIPYCRSYNRSGNGRENTLSPSDSKTRLVKLSSSSPGSSSKFTRKSSPSKDKGSGYSNLTRSKDDSVSSKYKCPTADLTKGSEKYIVSRFLPKNSVERSYTAYSRPPNVRTNEASRKNKELLTVLHVQKEQEKLSSASTYQSSSLNPKEPIELLQKSSSISGSSKESEMETTKVCPRKSSPRISGTTRPSLLRSPQIDSVKTEKSKTSKTLNGNMIDKETQIYRRDEPIKPSTFTGAARINATPWSSILDMEFCSPKDEISGKAKMGNEANNLKNVPKTDCIKTTNDKATNFEAAANTNLKLGRIPTLNSEVKKILPPSIPDSDDNKKNCLLFLNTPNKDFRKSVLNMNPHASKTRIDRRSNSASSGDSDTGHTDAIDVSENLSSWESCHETNPNFKIVPKFIGDKNEERKLPSSKINRSGVSSSENTKGNNFESTHLRTSPIVSLPEQFVPQQTNNKPPNSKQKIERKNKETSAKHFLLKALAPVTNLLKGNHESQDNLAATSESSSSPTDLDEQGGKVIWILNGSSDSISEENKDHSQIDTTEEKIKLEGFLENNSESSIETIRDLQSLNELAGTESDEYNKVVSRQKAASVRQNLSGEAPWWLDSSQPIPEGVQDYNIETGPIIKHVKSGESAWLLDNTCCPADDAEHTCNCVTVNNKTNQSIEPEIVDKPKFNRVPSGEQGWWLEETSHSPEVVAQYQYSLSVNNVKKENPQEENNKLRIRHISSGEKAWWLEENSSNAPEGIKDYNEDNSKITEFYENYSSQLKIKASNSGEFSSSVKMERDFSDDSEAEYGKYHKKNNNGDKCWWNSNHVTAPPDVREYTKSQQTKPNEMMQSDSESNSGSDVLDSCPVKSDTFASPEYLEKHKIRHVDSGELAWWIDDDDDTALNNSQVLETNESRTDQRKYDDHIFAHELDIWNKSNNQAEKFSSLYDFPLGDRASPEGLEMPTEPNENCLGSDNAVCNKTEFNNQKQPIFISCHKNIDAVLGNGVSQLLGPAMNNLLEYETGSLKKTYTREIMIHEGQPDNKKNSVVLRTQLSVKVHTIIEKLLTSEGRELRRVLFSLKQVFQEDKDLVHEFVRNEGLSCLIKVGSEADQNYQNYILRALGQVMLYVDGMNGVIQHNQTIQWLYTLISSKFRLVVKTALKLLLVFVEYTESNCMLLIKAISTIDYSQGLLPYYNIMKLLKDFDAADEELLIYAATLVNKILNATPEQDIYYDQIDFLEEQGMESIIRRYFSKQGTDLDLLQQFRIYETVLQYEDDDEKSSNAIKYLDESIRRIILSRNSLSKNSERRKSKRHRTGASPFYEEVMYKNRNNVLFDDYDESSSSNSGANYAELTINYKENDKGKQVGVTPAMKRRRERAERQRSFMQEQQETAALLKRVVPSDNDNKSSNEDSNGNINGHQNSVYSQRFSANGNNTFNQVSNRIDLTSCLDTLKKENTVKDLTQRLANQSIVQGPADDLKMNNRFGDMSGLISKAKEGLAKSKSRIDILKSPTNDNLVKIESKKSENELRWQELVVNLKRPLHLCDMDFTDLATDDETDILALETPVNDIPPPPPPFLNMENTAPPPPPLSNKISNVPPLIPSATNFGTPLVRSNSNANRIESKASIKKNKKTVKLFWKEVRDDSICHSKLRSSSIWDELSPVIVDTQKLEHLFESRAKDIISKKQQELNKNKEVIVLDPKRSNAINIGMTKLPPPRSIKTAILKMDATVMNREGIEKLMTMLPTNEERAKIQEAQAANPDIPLGSAEQFLLTLASISELPARLKLWAFKLDFDNSEKEIAEPLMDLKQGFEMLKINKTFRAILSTLLSVGNFLNGNEVKGFQIEYLTKVPEVKDTVYKHSLLHHLCYILMEKFPEASDLYSEVGAITRASKVDFVELTLNIQRLEADCKASWDHLKSIAKHDGSTTMKVRMSEFLSDCAERIILLGTIHRRIINRYHKFLLWLGLPLHQAADTKPNEFCRIISEFALEYRTTRERVIQQLEKKAKHRERNKTRGKMITDMGKFRSKEDRADAELRQLLGSDISDVESAQGTLSWRHRGRDSVQSQAFQHIPTGQGGDDVDDEIMESLVKTVTKCPRTALRERKRTRLVDRKYFKRSRTRENNPFGNKGSA